MYIVNSSTTTWNIVSYQNLTGQTINSNYELVTQTGDTISIEIEGLNTQQYLNQTGITLTLSADSFTALTQSISMSIPTSGITYQMMEYLKSGEGVITITTPSSIKKDKILIK